MYIHVGNTSTLYVFVDERQVVQSVLLTALQKVQKPQETFHIDLCCDDFEDLFGYFIF